MRRIFLIILSFLLLSFTIYRCFYNLENSPIERWDEQTNISVVSDTLSRNSFPILYLDNKPFFEKPPLWYFVGLATSAATGVHPISLRIVSAVFGFGVIVLTAFVAYQWWGLLSGYVTWSILLLTNHLFVTNPSNIFSTHTFRSIDVDSLFIFLLVTSFAVQNKIAKGFLAALATLTKGPLGILPIIVHASRKSFLVYCITVFPWYAYMTLLFGLPFLQNHFGYHIGQRVFSPIEGHNNPTWYFVSIITNRSFFPSWELLVFAVLWILFSPLYKKDSHIRYSFWMLVSCFLIPTVTQTRLAWYILPMYPFAGLMIAGSMSNILLSFHGKSSKMLRH